MYYNNEELNKLIELTLADGKITEKEIYVIYSKAEALGIDIDIEELEVILEAKLHLRQKESVPQEKVVSEATSPTKVVTEKRNEVIKCPSCNDMINALSRVCPSCKYVLDARAKSVNSDKGLEDLIYDIENTLVEIKSIPQPNFVTSLINRGYIFFPILNLVILVIGIRLDITLMLLLGLGLIWVSYMLIKRKWGSKVDSNGNVPAFSNLKAKFEKFTRMAHVLYGENKKVQFLLEELKSELLTIEAKRKRGNTVEYIGYLIIALITIGAFLIPESFSPDYEGREHDKGIMVRAEQLIKEDNVKEASLLLSEIQLSDNAVLLKSKIQLYELSKQMEALEPLLKDKKYAEVKAGLSKIIWEKISTDFSGSSIERDIYKSFVKRKTALNDELPNEYKVKMESDSSI